MRYFLKIFITYLSVFFTLLIFKKPAVAQVIDSSFYGWTVQEFQEDELDDKECYIVNFPVNSESNQPSRQKSYIMITRFRGQRTEEVSVYGGFEYKGHSKIYLMVDDVQFRLPTKKDMAWAKNKHDDLAIIQKMLNSASVRVRSDSAIGTFAIDEYSMQGITRAYARMREICK